jgi:hypothetical protein
MSLAKNPRQLARNLLLRYRPLGEAAPMRKELSHFVHHSLSDPSLTWQGSMRLAPE